MEWCKVFRTILFFESEQNVELFCVESEFIIYYYWYGCHSHYIIGFSCLIDEFMERKKVYLFQLLGLIGRAEIYRCSIVVQASSNKEEKQRSDNKCVNSNYFLVWCVFDVFIVFIIELNILWSESDLRIDVVESMILLIFCHLLKTYRVHQNTGNKQ